MLVWRPLSSPINSRSDRRNEDDRLSLHPLVLNGLWSIEAEVGVRAGDGGGLQSPASVWLQSVVKEREG